MKDYRVERAAVEVRRVDRTPEQREIERVETLRTRFGWLNKQWIAVSFVHMAITMMLFSDGGFFTTGALLIMVLGIDLALLWLSTYIETQRRFRQPIGFWPWIAFFVALFVEWGFNTAALWSHKPDTKVLPEALSNGIAILFGTFVALIIYVSATVQARLDRTAEWIREDERARLRKEADAEQQRRDEERRRQREERERNRASESHNEAILLPAPDEAALLPRSGNGKSAISTTDAPAILAALRAAGVARFATAAELARVCGWSSSSSATKARDTLLAAGALREDGAGGFVVVFAAKV